MKKILKGSSPIMREKVPGISDYRKEDGQPSHKFDTAMGGKCRSNKNFVAHCVVQDFPFS